MLTNIDYVLNNGSPKKSTSLKNKIKKIDDWEIAPLDLLIDRSQLIGKGEFGHVYLAKWRSTQVVAKIMNKDIGDDQKNLFLNEFDNLSKSHHPNTPFQFSFWTL